MLLVSATVGPFRSINEAQEVEIDEDLTVLVGMNEAGKTVFLKALNKTGDVLGVDKFDPVEDFPRRRLNAYLKTHATEPAEAVVLTFEASDDEIIAINEALGTKVTAPFSVSVTTRYNNAIAVGLEVDEKPVIATLGKVEGLSSDAAAAVSKADKLSGIPSALSGLNLTEPDQAFLKKIESRIAAATKHGWPDHVIAFEAWQWVSPGLPRFLYFGDYEILPSKMNLADLATQVANGKSNPKILNSEHRGVLALLRMADIGLTDFSDPTGYETLKAKIEAVSIHLTDQIMSFWKQNEDLEVEIDIKADPHDQPPFNNGPNLYLRIKNRRHRGVSTPFRQRSRGFTWFFSFMVWFDDVKHQLELTERPSRPLVLLLDEPGLSLHALAQADFLKYLDSLAERHQVIYSTHSPFMIHSGRLDQIRTVEDRINEGTVISSNISASDPRTVFPLQAALGYRPKRSPQLLLSAEEPRTWCASRPSSVTLRSARR
jgi:hypothetical protein